MERHTSHDSAGGPADTPALESERSRYTGEAGAWEPLDEGFWMPHRVRGSNRGRALG